ncbi:MAG: hypothetical protein U9R72_16845 [Chloroflexota bacterium]|nr:hypothetical protein [Chloroflexota bacterium]
MGAFIDQIGGALIYPFFTLCITRKFNVGMTDVGLANSLQPFLLSTLLVGLLAHFGGPAQQAMVADPLPPGKRAQGFGIRRVAGLVIDYADPEWVWYGTAAVGLLAAGMFLLLQRRTARSFGPAEEPAAVAALSRKQAPRRV